MSPTGSPRGNENIEFFQLDPASIPLPAQGSNSESSAVEDEEDETHAFVAKRATEFDTSRRRRMRLNQGQLLNIKGQSLKKGANNAYFQQIIRRRSLRC